ncbi:MAG: isoprenyl transferase [Pseudomonadota bacterium]
MAVQHQGDEAPALAPAPKHVAIIMDGNGRWALSRGLTRTQGHRRGVESVRRAVQAAGDLGIAHLTLFSFSSENWSRPRNEVMDLMSLAKHFIRKDLSTLHENGVKIRVIGARAGVDPEIISLIEHAEALTAGNTKLQLTFAFNYGGRDEIVRAAQRIAQDVADGRLAPDAVSIETFSGHLDTHPLPDVDLLIRTSGEFRISNFLLWQCAYAELVFMDLFWPDFTQDSFMQALETYRSRDRRFGNVAPLNDAC